MRRNFQFKFGSALLIASASMIGSYSAAHAETDFVVATAKINPVMQPKPPPDALGECARDKVCSSLAKVAADYLGVPPVATSAAIAILTGGKPPTSEEGRYSMSLPDGYTYCHAQIRLNSVVPADGKRAPIFSAASVERGLTFYTWTPKRGMGEGRSWVDADVSLYGVRTAIAKDAQNSSKCTVPGKTIEDCRGNGGGDRPACKSASD
jgi:hypothetical protein